MFSGKPRACTAEPSADFRRGSIWIVTFVFLGYVIRYIHGVYIWIEDVRTLSVYIKYYLLNCAGAAACPCENVRFLK